MKVDGTQLTPKTKLRDKCRPQEKSDVGGLHTFFHPLFCTDTFSKTIIKEIKTQFSSYESLGNQKSISRVDVV